MGKHPYVRVTKPAVEAKPKRPHTWARCAGVAGKRGREVNTRPGAVAHHLRKEDAKVGRRHDGAKTAPHGVLLGERGTPV